MTTQRTTPTAARVTLGYVEEEEFNTIPLETRNGTYSAVAAGQTISHAAAGNKFADLQVGQPLTPVGGTNDGKEGTITDINTSADPHVVTLSGATLVDGAADITDIKAYPTMRLVAYQSGGLSMTSETDDEAGKFVRADLRRNHGILTGLGAEGSVEDNLSTKTQFYDFSKSVFTNNDGWVAQEVQTGVTLTVAVIAGTPDTYEITGPNNWLDNIDPGHFVKIEGANFLLSNPKQNGTPVLVTEKDLTGGAGNHKILVENGIAFAAGAGIAGCTVTRAKTLRDGQSFVSYMFHCTDPNMPLYERYNGVLIGGMEISHETEGRVTCNFSLTPAGDRDWNPKSDDAVTDGYTYHSTLLPLEDDLAYAGANTIYRYKSGFLAIQSASYNVEDRYEALRLTKSDEAADSIDNQKGYYPSDFFAKTFMLSGNVNALFTTTELMETFERDKVGRVDIKFQQRLEDGTGGNTIIASAPSIKISGFDPDPGEVDAARTASYDWSAAEWTHVDADGNRHAFMGQLSVFHA